MTGREAEVGVLRERVGKLKRLLALADKHMRQSKQRIAALQSEVEGLRSALSQAETRAEQQNQARIDSRSTLDSFEMLSSLVVDDTHRVEGAGTSAIGSDSPETAV